MAEHELRHPMTPGRSCPLPYRYAPSAFERAADLHAETIYVIGGLYGNVPALHAILQLAAAEPVKPTLIFNGDFNWFGRREGEHVGASKLAGVVQLIHLLAYSPL